MDTFSTTTRRFTNDLGIPCFVLIVRGEFGDFIGGACDTWDEADERANDDFPDLFVGTSELAPGETLDLDITDSKMWFDKEETYAALLASRNR